MTQKTGGANIVMEMVSYKMNEMRNDASQGILSMIIWGHLKLIRKFEKTTRHFFFIWNKHSFTQH
jgi:hypothetical protein